MKAIINKNNIVDLDALSEYSKELMREHESLMNHLVKKTMLDVQRKFDISLKEYLINNLEHFGFHFENDEAFMEFAKERIQRITFEDRTEVEYYLDFVDEDNRGKFIGITNENKVDFQNDGVNFNVSIG